MPLQTWLLTRAPTRPRNWKNTPNTIGCGFRETIDWYGQCENEQVVDLLYVGLKTPDLYERLGLGRSSTHSDD